ncbi:CoB--CoM heterodisulfide reductase iron-sulfur subunit B family protein [bacterium]|nr:CoB--CoM heterodisulfide reductase iron-sulfur subunit B family protein [bacterium]MBU1072151.1 CoB--CoM heterodisulfide reductase iron-sulfur subunit B family protein [bacterium]MBU1676244.1 CoB--CoM heterodisulfide reductase iron-sulfur subunit B family protein [bacterium]
MKHAFFPGCMIQIRYPQMEAAVRKTVPGLGIELVDLPGLGCCPDPVFFKSLHKLDWVTLAARNLVIAERAGLDYVTICSGCTETLAEAAHLLNQGGELLERVNARLATIDMKYEGTVNARHLITVLRDEVGLEAVKASVKRPLEGVRIAVHYGCHLLKPRDIMQVDDPDHPTIFEDMLEAIGATPVNHTERIICCGKACRDCDLPEQMTRTVLESIHAADVDIMGVICPSCFDSFDTGQLKLARKFDLGFTIPPVYYFQLLALAQGLSAEAVGLDRHKIRPEKLLAGETAG